MHESSFQVTGAGPSKPRTTVSITLDGAVLVRAVVDSLPMTWSVFAEEENMADTKPTTTTTQQPKPAPQPQPVEHPAGEQVPQSPGSTPTREPAGTPARQA